MTDYLELGDLSLDDAMIQYAYNGYGRMYVEHAWKEFKEFYECEETPTELFDRFWDDIMPNLNNYEMVRNAPVIAENLSRIHNPRTYPPRPPKTYDNVKEMSLFEFKKQQTETMQRKMFNDPKMLALKTHCLDYINKLRAEPHTQPEKNQVSTNRGSLHIIDQSVLEQRVPPSSSDSRVGQMTCTNLDSTSSSSPEMDQPTMTHVRQSLIDSDVEGTSRVSQGSANRSSMSGSRQSTIEQSVRLSSSDSRVGRTTCVSLDSTSSTSPEMDQSTMTHTRQSLLDSDFERTSRVSQGSTNRSSMSGRSESRQSTMEQAVPSLSSDVPIGRISRRVSQNSASSSILPGTNQSAIEQSIRQLSSHSQMSRGTQKRVSRDSTSQRSTSERSSPDVTLVVDLSESISESESETPSKRRRSADVE